ncbi:2'-5' RNA ligase [Fontibacillus solani]|uniref:RNA 2',3'-cyclic phosphodiesterase n=1 Tax=Fontibacillus solani TaxID=1572857 RepID=A0A7W3XRE4_9BACL|nr:RNA 2',3'-cyclic phosphodiesterase [Fontibacillus solani]MBA9085459.1 2'-5' RNA ligase [Fontibacillus solani]
MLANGNSKQLWRIFIAVPIPEEIKQTMNSWSREHRAQLQFRKWVHAEDYHITVQFLGDTEADRIGELKEVLMRRVSEIASFKMEAVGVGTFGRPRQPRVLWGGVNGDITALHNLYYDVTSSSAELGYIAEDRPYHPHITIARKYREEEKLNPEVISALNTKASFGTWITDRIVIYRTNLGNQPMYEEIASISLKKS